jgi:hypothetical protein
MASTIQRTVHRIIQDLLIASLKKPVKGRAMRCNAPSATLIQQVRA